MDTLPREIIFDDHNRQDLAILYRNVHLAIAPEKNINILSIFVIDNSGSMVVNYLNSSKRETIIRESLHLLLTEIENDQDKVALINICQFKVEVNTPPTDDVDLIKKQLEKLSRGGGSPLASGLTTAINLGIETLNTGQCDHFIIILLTDGRCNISLFASQQKNLPLVEVNKAEIQAQVLNIADQIRGMGIPLLVLDTERKFVSSGFCQILAEQAGGHCYSLLRLKKL